MSGVKRAHMLFTPREKDSKIALLRRVKLFFLKLSSSIVRSRWNIKQFVEITQLSGKSTNFYFPCPYAHVQWIIKSFCTMNARIYVFWKAKIVITIFLGGEEGSFERSNYYSFEKLNSIKMSRIIAKSR